MAVKIAKKIVERRQLLGLKSWKSLDTGLWGTYGGLKTSFLGDFFLKELS
ncbi:MAG: hypothetical protein AAGG59_05705 [Bacteroidota bacterium]